MQTDKNVLNLNTILATRPYPDSYTQEILNNIKLVNWSEHDPALPFGSYALEQQLWPGDIDLSEFFYDCCSIDEVVHKFFLKTKRVIRDIIATKEHYFSEFKTGEDMRYAINIGSLLNGVWFINRKNIVFQTRRFRKKKLISEAEYKTIMSIVRNKHPTQDDYDILFNLFRNHRVIRWTEDEILQGYKMLPGKLKFKFIDGLKQKSHIKIDVLAYINNRFIEVTNFFYLVLEKPNEKPYIINVGDNYTSDFFAKRIEEQLPIDIEKLFYSKYYFSAFKGVKRMWALARYFRDPYVVGLLEPFIAGRISLLYQLRSELETIITLLERVHNPPKNSIAHAIQEIKSRIAYVLEIHDKQAEYFILLNSYKQSEPKSNMELLKKISKMMKADINEYTIGYLKMKGLFPIPPKYLPKILSYASG